MCVWVVFLLGCIREENYPCGVLVGFGLVGLDDALRDPALLLRLFNPFSNTSIRKANPQPFRAVVCGGPTWGFQTTNRFKSNDFGGVSMDGGYIGGSARVGIPRDGV